MSSTVIFLLSAVAVIFGVMKKHHQGWVAFAGIVLGIALMHSTLASPADAFVTGLAHFGDSLLQALRASM